MAPLLDKTAIIDKIEKEYQALEDLLAPLDGWQLTTPGTTDVGSVKDMLAHLAAWQKHLLAILQAACQGKEPGIPIRHLTCEEIERLNQGFYAAARARPLREVWAAFRATYTQVQQAIESLSEEAITDPERFAWLDGSSLRRLIADSTYEHYHEHGLGIRAWLSN